MATLWPRSSRYAVFLCCWFRFYFVCSTLHSFCRLHIAIVKVLGLGTLLALAYNWVHIAFIQRTTSVFVAVAGNFKIVLIIALSELLVQNTHLPPGSLVGIAIVVVSFLGSFSEREIQRRVQILNRITSCVPCGKCWKALLTKVGCRNNNNKCSCCRRRKRQDAAAASVCSTFCLQVLLEDKVFNFVFYALCFGRRLMLVTPNERRRMKPMHCL